MFLLHPQCLQNFKKIKDQLLCHQTNVIVTPRTQKELGT